MMSKHTVTSLDKQTQKAVPSLRGMPFLGVLPDFMKDPLEVALKAQQLGGIVRLPVGPAQIYLLSDPKLIKHVLEDRSDIYTRDSFTRNIVSVFSGSSIFTSDGAVWQRKRTLLEPAYSHEMIAVLAKIVTDATTTMLQRWEDFAHKGTGFDAYVELKRLASEIVCRMSVGSNLSHHDVETLTHCIDTAQDWIDNHRKNFITLPINIPTPRNRAMRQAMQTFDSLVYRAIDEQKRHEKQGESLISLMLQMRDATTGEGPTNQDIRDEIAQGLSGYHQIA